MKPRVMPPVTLTVVPMGQPIPLDTECCRRRSSLKRPSHSQLESPSHSQLESNPHSVAGSPNLIVPAVQRTHRVVLSPITIPRLLPSPSSLRVTCRLTSPSPRGGSHPSGDHSAAADSSQLSPPSPPRIHFPPILSHDRVGPIPLIGSRTDVADHPHGMFVR